MRQAAYANGLTTGLYHSFVEHFKKYFRVVRVKCVAETVKERKKQTFSKTEGIFQTVKSRKKRETSISIADAFKSSRKKVMKLQKRKERRSERN